MTTNVTTREARPDTVALSRRAFLTATGALVVALAAPAELAAAEKSPFGRSVVRPDKLSSYISIEPNGSVVAYYGKIDGGQGLETSIAQMVAEEIDVAWERVRVVMGDTGLTVDMGGATAGNGLRQGGMIMRQTAAEARRLLIEMAGKMLDTSSANLIVTDGIVQSVTEPAKRVSYAELVSRQKLDGPIAWRGFAQQLGVKVAASLKQPAEFKVIGKPMPRRDMAGKVFGTLQQCSDVRLPNMAHARIIRPRIAGAVPVTVDEQSIADIAGAKVVRIKDFLAVVAEKEWNAVKASQALKVTWSESKPRFPGNDKLFDHIRQAAVVKRSSDPGNEGAAAERVQGSVEDGFKQAVRVFAGEYEFPTQSHASMGPACAVADVHDDHATVWTSTQKPHDCAAGIAELLDLPPAKVRAIWMFGTGGYARDGQGDATAEAALLSQHLGRPVRVQHMRHEGLAWDPKGTATINRSRVGLDASGKVIAYENISKAFSMEDCNTREQHPADTLAGMALGLPLNFRPVFGIPGNGYTFENARWGWEVIAPLMDRASPLRSTHIRDPFGLPILFGSESVLDEVAVATKQDPIEFRLRHLKNKREHELFAAAAKQYGWDTRPSPRNDQAGAAVATGRGFAYRQLAGTFVATIAEVRVDRATGAVEVTRIVCAHDCGLIVNPETIRHVVDRQLVYGTSRTLWEEVQFDQNMVQSVDWLTYPVIKMDSVPKSIEIVLIDRPEEPSSGAAEMAVGTLPAAIGNAIFDATGVRLRRLPFTPARVKAALSRA
ncbi:MAG TPA: molybdopterin cofactor-binding domain-containing protein [Xanthobacteraceae bacterium]|nr:molybdopterin cofactor-binding domain-containing protein [Xanthobacteraceae bacterium]